MIDEAKRLAAIDPTALDDRSLAGEVVRRAEIHNRWVEVYWKEFIPFAHGARLFGQVYNDAVRPDDPFEFVRLLSDNEMVSLQRNRTLAELAETIRRDARLAAGVKSGTWEDVDAGFLGELDDFVDRFGPITFASQSLAEAREHLAKLLLQMAKEGTSKRPDETPNSDRLRRGFLQRFDREARQLAEDLLALARASYRLRDDDNVYLGRLEAAKSTAVAEARRRLESNRVSAADRQALQGALDRAGSLPIHRATSRAGRGDPALKARQLVGQPAGPGVATATARVVVDSGELFDFQRGEILVCDAVDPNVTFVVPLCAGIVERRGGMLIHGAIIAREYGLPCVTGVPEATDKILTGDRVTVDGYLGIVTIEHRATATGESNAEER
jgi:pyruvate,water dikinase